MTAPRSQRDSHRLLDAGEIRAADPGGRHPAAGPGDNTARENDSVFSPGAFSQETGSNRSFSCALFWEAGHGADPAATARAWDAEFIAIL